MVVSFPSKPVTVAFGQPGGAFYPCVPITSPGFNLTVGFDPHEEILLFVPKDAKAIVQAAKGTNGNWSLQFRGHYLEEQNGGPFSFERLRVLGFADPINTSALFPPGTPADERNQFIGVIVVDRRYELRKKIFKRTYNERVISSRKIIISSGEVPVEVADLQNDVIYRPGSLFPGTEAVWSARILVIDVWNEVAGTFGQDWDFDFGQGGTGLPDQTVDNLFIATNGHQAMAIACSFLTGTDGTVDSKGKFLVINRIPGAARLVIESFPPPIQGSSHLVLQDMSLQRPRLFRHGFEIEAEIRFDLFADIESRTDQDRFLENVLQTVDKSTSYTNTEGRSFQVGPGNWFTFAQMRESPTWAPPKGLKVPSSKLTEKKIQFGWLNQEIEFEYVLGNGEYPEPDLLWARRTASVRAHYRQTYRPNKNWAHNARVIRMQRVQMLSPETGARASAQAFTIVSYIPSLRGIRTAQDNGQALTWITDNSVRKTQRIKEQVKGPSRARLQLLDNYSGIFRAEFRTDIEGLTTRVIPSGLADVPRATDDPGFFVTLGQAKLRPEHRLAVIITMVPLTQSFKELRVVETTPVDVQRVLGASVTVGDTFDLPEERLVGESILTARYAWDPANEDPLKKTFGVEKVNRAQGPFLGDADNEDELSAYADASSAAIMSQFLDHYVGTTVIPFSPKIRPMGEIRAVRHGITPDGKLFTTVVCAYGPRLINDISVVLPLNYQRKILGLTNPNGV